MDYLKQLDSLPPEQQWLTVRDWLKTESPKFSKALRAYRPILHMPDCTVIANFDQVMEALKQPEIFSVQLYKPKMGSYLMTEDNTPLHNEDKAIMMSLLKREDVPKIRSFIASQAASLLDEAQGQIDGVKDYGRLVPALMVQNIFGLDGVNPRKLIRWSYWNQYSAFRNQHFQVTGNSKKVERSKIRNNIMAAIYMAGLLWRKHRRLKKGQPDNDSVTRLIQENFPKHGSSLIFRKGINAGGLLIGSVETTSEAVTHILSELHKRPDMWTKAQQLAQADNTDSFDRICWEALRFRPIAPYIFRKMAQDYTFQNQDGTSTTLKAGQTVLCYIASAMFDEVAFPSPDTFDITRPFGKSFHFGYGHHECLGREIGMVMVPEMVRQLFLRHDLKLEQDFEYLGKPFAETNRLSWRTV